MIKTEMHPKLISNVTYNVNLINYSDSFDYAQEEDSVDMEDEE